MESGDYKGAIPFFERARAQTRYHTSRALSVVSLVSSLTAVLQRIETARKSSTDVWMEV